KRLMPLDAPLGRRTLLTAFSAAAYTDVLGEVLAVVADLDEPPLDLEDPSSTADCLLFGFLHRLTGSPDKAIPLLRAAIEHLRNPDTPDGVRMSVPAVVSVPAGAELMDDDAALDALNACVRFARRTGALRVLAPALSALAIFLTYHGRFDEAEAACAEGRVLAAATGAPGSPDMASLSELALSAWRGSER